MDFLNDMLSGRGCDVDGTTTSNPINLFVDQMLNSHLVGADYQNNSRHDQMEGGLLDNNSDNVVQESNRFQYLNQMVPPQQDWIHDFNTIGNDEMSGFNSAWDTNNSASLNQQYNPQGMQPNINFMNSPYMNQFSPNMMFPSQYQMGGWSPHPSMMMPVTQSNYNNKQYDSMKESHYNNITTAGETSEETKVHFEASHSVIDTDSSNNITELEHDFQQSVFVSDGATGSTSFFPDTTTMDTSDLMSDALPSQSGLDLAWHSVLTRLESEHASYSFSPLSSQLYLAETTGSSSSLITTDTTATGNTPQEQDSQALRGYEQGMEEFRNGHIDEAIISFELELQRDAEHSEAWKMLGKCHAEHEEDKRAISCFLKARESDPYNLDALICLGTSYVNDLNSVGALDALKTWVTHNPSFHGLQVVEDGYSDGSLMDVVMNLMVQAERWAPNDLDVLVVLGVLYNVSQDYDHAVDCFRRALALHPEDYTLHNKLGATLANSNRSSEAISHYASALRYRPRYARGWLNLGVAYSNLNRLEEAARAYLEALKINRNASHIWGYLRGIFASLDRFDLLEACKSEDIEAVSSSFH